MGCIDTAVRYSGVLKYLISVKRRYGNGGQSADLADLANLSALH